MANGLEGETKGSGGCSDHGSNGEIQFLIMVTRFCRRSHTDFREFVEYSQVYCNQQGGACVTGAQAQGGPLRVIIVCNDELSAE